MTSCLCMVRQAGERTIDELPLEVLGQMRRDFGAAGMRTHDPDHAGFAMLKRSAQHAQLAAASVTQGERDLSGLRR